MLRRAGTGVSLQRSWGRHQELVFKMFKERCQMGVGPKDLDLWEEAGDGDGKSDKPTL